MTRFYASTLIVLLALFVTGCSYEAPDDRDVRAAFLKENANVVVTSVSSVYPNVPPGERGGDIVHKHVRFRTSSAAPECEVVWTYTDAVSTWTLSSKSAVGVPGTLCQGCTIKPCPTGTS
jgi:hypothetical protein